jgi:ABC-type antimicrobial peptide transport system ATPase subunit
VENNWLFHWRLAPSAPGVKISLLIACKLAEPACVAYWSAIRYWNWTEQLPQMTYMQTTQRKNSRQKSIFGIRFEIVTVPGKGYFGMIKQWEGSNSPGMALIQRPKLLLMDEPSPGLSPAFVKQVFQMIRDLNKNYGMAILIVEQKVKEVLALAIRTYVLRLGKVALEGNSSQMLKAGEYKKIFLT